jgi:hypothetical protein
MGADSRTAGETAPELSTVPADSAAIDETMADLAVVPADGGVANEVALDLPSLPVDGQTAAEAPIDLSTVQVDGDAAAEAPIDLPIAPLFSLTMTPSTLDFGGIRVGTTSAAKTFKVTNVGEAASGAVAVVKKDSAFSVGGASQFSYRTTCQTPLAPAQSCDIIVTFTPIDTGTFSAILTASDGIVSSEDRTVVGVALPYVQFADPCPSSTFTDTVVG